MEKMVFIDIDGTLRNSKREVTPRVAESIKKARSRGIQVVLCSARSRKYTEGVKEVCGADDWMINSNGAEIYQGKTKEILLEEAISKEACMQIYQVATQHHVALEMHTEDKIVYIYDPGTDRTGKEELSQPIENFLDTHKITQCVLSDPDFSLMESLQTELENIPNTEIQNRSSCLLYSHLPPRGRIYYNLNKKQISKGKAITLLCQHLGIPKTETIAIGDGINDISMFEAVGTGVAMGNALPVVKERASQIIATNDQDGVAQFLDTLPGKEEKL